MTDIKKELEQFIKTREKGCDFAYVECKKIIYKYQEQGKYRSCREYEELIKFICDKLEY
jgi:hypothetical protein